MTAANVQLNKHLVKSIAITDRDLADTGIQFVKDATAGIASIIGRGLNAYVFGMMNASNLPAGVNGVIINRNSVGIASRYLAPLAGAYPQTWKAVDPDSSFTLGFRLFADLKTGVRYLAGEALVGASIFYGGTKAVRLINSAG